jgi:hypothetical protein
MYRPPKVLILFLNTNAMTRMIDKENIATGIAVLITTCRELSFVGDSVI